MYSNKILADLKGKKASIVFGRNFKIPVIVAQADDRSRTKLIYSKHLQCNSGEILGNVIQRSTLPFRGEKPNFQKQLQNFEVAASKFNIDRHSTSTTSKGPSENLKKMSWDNPVSPIDAKNSIGFFVSFFLGQPGLLGDSEY